MKNRLNFFRWTDKDWDNYNNGSATIPLHVFEQMVDAMELLAKGQRLNKRDRKKWALFAEKRRSEYHQAILETIDT